MPTLDRCHVVVLAAGRGSRMGGPKALMIVGGEVWWRVQSRRLHELGLAATWVVSHEVHSALAKETDAPDRLVLGDSTAPMFTSVLLGVRSLSTSPPTGVFILPVDAPAPSQTVWQSLAVSESVAFPAFQGKRGHPVYLPWSWIAETLNGPVASSRDPSSLRLDELIAPVAHAVNVSDSVVACNLNTPDDVLRFLSILPSSVSPNISSIGPRPS